METRQMATFFASTSPALFVTFIFVFENSQNSFLCDPLFGPFWSVKYINFGQQLPIQTAHHIFPESRHTEVTKNLYYVLSPVGSQRKVSARGPESIIILQKSLSSHTLAIQVCFMF